MNLVGLEGNAFNLIAHFRKKAKAQDWTDEEINAVIWRATSKDYSVLLNTLVDYTEAVEEHPNMIVHNGKTYYLDE